MGKVDDTQETLEHQDSFLGPAVPATPQVAHLRVVHRADSLDEGLAILLKQGQYVLGRTPGESPEFQSITLADRGVSRQHLQIRRRLVGTTIRDLRSRNGSFLNGRPVPESWIDLQDGDLIRVGESLLIYREQPPVQGPWADPFLPGHAPAIAYARRRIHQLAELPVPVLLLGETGTGKEYAARALHLSGLRAAQPFVPVNCGELSRGLSRAELFGREAGAYTDAKSRQGGLVSQAGEGTLFLDEIGDLDLDVQVELVRFLQDGAYRRVGGDKLLHAPARVVAATHVSMKEAVSDGRFRQDLLARLRAPVAPVRLPPLRERREDVLQWARIFLKEEAARFGLRVPQWSVGFAECLLIHPWADNLRELRMVIGTALLELEGVTVLEAHHLADQLMDQRRRARMNPLESRIHLPTLTATPGAPSKAQIEEALKQTGGVMKAAAEALGIDRRKLYRLCKQLRVQYQTYRPADEEGEISDEVSEDDQA